MWDFFNFTSRSSPWKCLSEIFNKHGQAVKPNRWKSQSNLTCFFPYLAPVN